MFNTAGKQLVRKDGFQHNRKLRRGGAFDGNAISELVRAVMEMLEKDKDATAAA